VNRDLGRLLLAAFIFWLAYLLVVPGVIWDGRTWITIHVEVTDATTHKPVPGAALSLQTELRTKFPDAEVDSPTVLSARSDSRGQATLKDMFSAGGDQSGTGVHVGTSSVRCAAAGYQPASVPLSETGRLRFRKFLFYEQSSSVTVRLSLQRQ